MSQPGKRNICLALVITALLANLLYLIGRDRPTGLPVQSFWQDDLAATLRFDRITAAFSPISVTLTKGGAQLSQIWTLPLQRSFHDILFDRVGQIYLVTDSLARYDPQPGTLTDLFRSPRRTIRTAVMGSDQRIYSLWRAGENDALLYFSVYESK